MAINKSDITSAFQSELGRAPTQAEFDYFLKMGQTVESGGGGLSGYEAQQAIGATPGAQLRTLGQYADLYGQRLGQSDQYMLGQAQNQLQSQFRQMGRPSSSGYISAFAQAAQNLAMNRQAQMAQFYGQGLQGAMGDRFGAGQVAADRSYNTQQNWIDFNRQKQLARGNYDKQMDYANTQNRRGQQAGLMQAGIGLAGGLLLGPVGGIAGGYFAGRAMRNNAVSNINGM